MMPSRMIRDAILESDRFLSLPDNTARVCYIACLLTADDRGNREASTGALVRLWRDFGVDSNAKASDIAQFLGDKDLIRVYDVAGKQYMHIPRFGQRMRSFKRACPPSPWCENIEESTKSSGICQQVAAGSRKSRPEVKRSEEKKTKSHFVLPSWIPSDAWDAFEESRKKLRKPLTDRARQLSVAELQRLRDQGHAPVAVIERAVLRGWLTFYPLAKDSGPGTIQVDA